MTLSAALLSFAVVAGLMTLTPGLDTALVLRSALRHGRSAAMVTALGIQVGILTWAAASAVGISALLTASEVAYTALKVLGSVYMLWLGGSMLLNACRRVPQGHEAPQATPATEAVSWGACFRRGLLTNLLNPKVGAFYVALLPQFLPDDTAPLLAGVALGLVHTLEGLVWLSVLAYGAHYVRHWLGQPRIQRMVDGVAGMVVVGFGLKLGLGEH